MKLRFLSLLLLCLPAYGSVISGITDKLGTYDLGGRLLIDRSLEVTGALQVDKYEEFVNASTPTTPSTKHAREFMSESGMQLCVVYDDGSISCLPRGGTSSITSIVAGNGITVTSSSTSATISLSTPVVVTNGGTGFTSATRGDIVYSTATNLLTKLSIGTTSQELRVSTSSVPQWIFSYVNIRDYGAKCDGSTDDTTAIQNAVNTGKSVFVPPSTSSCVITNVINISTAGQTVYGTGTQSWIAQSSTGTKAGVFNITADSVTISNLGLYGNNVSTNEATTVGWTVYINAANHCKVKDNLIKRYARGGIGIFEGSYNIVSNNIVRDAQTDTSVLGAQTDIDVLYGGSNNLITSNIVSNGGGNGIGLLTIAGGLEADNNTISNNKIDTEDSYGIVIYRNDLTSPFISTVTITGNTIDNIKGAINVVANGGKAFGAGMYILDSEFVTITGNHINNTNIQTNSGQLEPAGIGLSNVFNFLISGNFINNSNGWNGVRVFNQQLDYDTRGFGAVVGNTFLNHATGVDVVKSTNIVVMGNNFSRISGNVILVEGDGTHINHNIKISDNIIKGGATGIVGNYISGGQITGNEISSHSLQGIYVVGCSSVQIVGNWTSNETSVANTIGIEVDTPGQNNLVASNFITGNATGLSIQVPTAVFGNEVYGNTNDYNFAGLQFQGNFQNFILGSSSTLNSPTAIIVSSITDNSLIALPVKSDSSGTLFNGQVSLSSDVVGSLPAASIAAGTLGSGVLLGYKVSASTGLSGNLSNNLAYLVSASTGLTGNLSNNLGYLVSLSTGVLGNLNYQVSVATGVTGVLPIANGGTNSSTGITDGHVMGSVGGKIVELSSGQVPGTSTNDNANTGNVGEYVSSSTLSTSSITINAGSGNYVNVTTVTITAGDWDCNAVVVASSNGVTGNNYVGGAISINSGNTTTDHINGDNVVYGVPPTNVVGSPQTDTFMVIPEYRISSSNTKAVYMKAVANFSKGNPKVYGRLSCRRVR